MIMWPKAKRSISIETAAGIAAAAREHGAQPIGVFVDEDAATIAARCKQAGIGIAQLHGDDARWASGAAPAAACGAPAGGGRPAPAPRAGATGPASGAAADPLLPP